MAVTHATETRNGIADYVVDQLDGGTIKLVTSDNVEVATLTFGNPAFGAAGAVVSGRADANAITSDSSATGGVAAKAELVTSGSASIVFCAVGTSDSDINLSSTTIFINLGIWHP